MIDTTLFNPYNEDVSLYSRNLYANIGIFGQAHYPMNFYFYRKHGFNYKTLPYNAYLRTIDNWQFHLPEDAYANLQYNFSNVKENRFSVAYAQKFTDELHFELGLESIIAEGRYIMQKIRNVNVGASLQYKLPSNRYGFKMYYYLNFINNQENGGIADEGKFEEGAPPTAIPVRFNTNYAFNSIFQNTFFLRHYLSMSAKKAEDSTSTTIKNKIGYLVHDFEVGNTKNRFEAIKIDPDYFTMFNFSQDSINDFVKSHQIRNSILWSSYMPEDTLPDKKYFIRFAAGIMHTFIGFKDTATSFKDNQLAPMGILHLKLFDRLHVKANAITTLNGYNAGDISFEGLLAMDFFQKDKDGENQTIHQLQFKAGFYNYSVDYFFTHLIANNYAWDTNLKKQQTITASIAWEHKNYSIGVNYYTLNNYTLLNEDCFPEQINKFANVYQLAAYIPFNVKGFGINSNVYLQYTDNEQIRVPLLATRQTIYYGHHLFKKALYLQLGLDFTYNTAYFGNEYNSVLQQFYLQNDKSTGNYPYLDVYLRLKLNRFQFQFKMTHFLAGVLGNYYYYVPYYPAKGRGFALGILWRFYD